MKFEWDQRKALSNEEKHGISFAEATTVFGDPMELTISDPDHSTGEYRFQSIGLSSQGNLLVVSYTEREEIVFESSALEAPQSNSRKAMSKTTKPDEMRPEYDFSGGIRGRHHRSYQEGTNVVLLETDVAKVFKDSDAVNHALRMLMEIAGKVLERNLTKS